VHGSELTGSRVASIVSGAGVVTAGVVDVILVGRRIDVAGGRRALAARRQGPTDAGLADPDRGGDRPQRRPAAAATADIGDHFLAQPRGAFRTTFARHQRGHPDIGHCPLPAPQGLGGDPETRRDSHGPRTLDPHQLHRGQPPTQIITGVPREDQLTADEDPPPGLVLHQTGHQPYLDRARGHQSQGQLSRHDRHRPLPQYWSETPY